jgi:hypothetical protein
MFTISSGFPDALASWVFSAGPLNFFFPFALFHVQSWLPSSGSVLEDKGPDTCLA